MSDVIETIGERAEDLKEEYTRRLDALANEIVPPMLSNSEYAARCSALLTALNRELARCAAAFGEVHGVSPQHMETLVFGQFRRNYALALEAVRGEGSTVQ